MSVLVDSSVWIGYFRGAESDDPLLSLIDENLVVINGLILAELIPALQLRRHRKLISLLRLIPKHPITIDWDELTEMQILCLRHGINGVGIPDLAIAQHAIQHDLDLYSHDKHFALLARHIPLSLY